MKRKLKYLFEIYAGATPKSDNPDFWDGDILWVTPADYKTSDKYISSGSRTITQEGYNSANTTLVPKGSLIVSKRAPIGTVCIADNPMCTNQGCMSCVPKKNVNSEFFYYVLSVITEEMEILGSGTTFQEISANNFGNLKVPYMDFDKQNVVVEFLNSSCSSIDESISRHRTIIDKLEEYRRSVITQAVTKGLNPNVAMKDSGVTELGKIPASWILCRLRYIGKPQNGISKSGEFFGEGFPFVTYGDVYKNMALPAKTSGLIMSSEDERERYSVEKGDIFFTRTSETIDEVGFSSVCECSIPDATFAGFLIRVRPYDEKMNTSFAKYYFRSQHLRNYFAREMDIVTRASLSQDFLKNVPVLLPPLDEQVKIAKYLDDIMFNIEGAIDTHQQLIEKLEEYKKSLIYNAVTGKIDCRKEA